MRGKFITFEGPDGSGKSTQVRLLAEQLINQGYQVVVTREPGGTKIAEKIRGILLDPDHQEMTARTEMLLYAAARAQHVEELIEPALAAGKIVICDRFTDSSLAYQGYGRGMDQGFLTSLIELATGGLAPDLTLVLDISYEAGQDRIKKSRGENGDRLELEAYEFHMKVRTGYLDLSRIFPGRIKVVAGDQPVTEVFQAVKRYVMDLLDPVNQDPPSKVGDCVD